MSSSPSTVLGISAYYHDSAAALLCGGEIVAAAQEERFTRIKHDAKYPGRAIAWCLEEAGVSVSDLDAVAFYDKPLLKFDRLMETYLAHVPRGLRSFRLAIGELASGKLNLRRTLRRELGKQFRGKLLFTEHHESHAASAFLPSPFEDAAILTVDGVGEWASASWGTGRGNSVELRSEMHFPHSLGLLYSAFTYFCGFRVNSGEYKLMGLAPYGEPRYVDPIRNELLEIYRDGSFWMDPRFFAYAHGLRMTSQRFDALFGGPPRRAESELTQREMDLAASVQVVTEEIVLKMAHHVREQTGMRNLCLAGGVALNCVANGKLARQGIFERLWVQPAAGDAGGALGAACVAAHTLLGEARPAPRAAEDDRQRGSLLGPWRRNADVARHFREQGAVFGEYPDEGDLLARVAELLDTSKVVGWFQGRMEFGPRALGGRSILADPRDPEMQRVVNTKIKFRESFRPFAPVVLRDHANEWFEMEGLEELASPYMLFVVPVRQVDLGGSAEQRGLAKLAAVRGALPAITHVDGSARVQTVDARSGRFHRLLQRWHERTGCPVLINTSFNVRGEPIVCTAEDALRCFLATDMDVLVVEDCLLLKEDQPASLIPDRQSHLEKFALD
jgi:carbamoyltransferase